jgi:hypothetical protein
VPGYIWHAIWYFRGGRLFELDRFWGNLEYYREPILLVCADGPSSIEVSFAAMEKPEIVADVIGKCFDSALYSLGPRITGDFIGLNRRASPRPWVSAWQQRYNDLDPRVHVWSPWIVIDGSMRSISIFDA